VNRLVSDSFLSFNYVNYVLLQTEVFLSWSLYFVLNSKHSNVYKEKNDFLWHQPLWFLSACLMRNRPKRNAISPVLNLAQVKHTWSVREPSTNRGVTIPSCHDSIHITIWYYCDTPRHGKRLTKNVLLIKMLTLILHCWFKLIGLNSGACYLDEYACTLSLTRYI